MAHTVKINGKVFQISHLIDYIFPEAVAETCKRIKRLPIGDEKKLESDLISLIVRDEFRQALSRWKRKSLTLSDRTWRRYEGLLCGMVRAKLKSGN